MRRLPCLFVLAVAACGSSGGSPPDARPIDAIGIDATPPPVTVRAVANGAPFAGASVVFLDATDTVIADTVLDGTGTASAIVPAGGKVVVLTVEPVPLGGPPPIVVAYAWLDVEPGVTYRLGVPADQPTHTTITAPTEPGATAYQAATSCATTQAQTPSIDVTMCGASDDIFVGAIGDTGYLGGFLTHDVPAAASVDLTAGVYRGTTSVGITATDVPVDVTSVDFIGSERAVKIPWGLGGLFNAPGPSASVTVPDLPDGVVRWQTTITRGTHPAQDVLAMRAQAANVTLDVGAGLLPDASAPSFDLASGTASWTISGAGAVTEAVASIDLARGGSPIVWHVAQPGAATSLHLPHLPATHDAANPRATDTITSVNLTIAGGSDPMIARAPFDLDVLLAGYSLPATIFLETI